MPRASWSVVGSLYLALPPVAEQAAIVKYLAHANARIDKAITAKRRLIALLEEEFRAEASALVLGQEVPGDRRHSKIQWIGSAPGHWSIEPLRARYRQHLGKMLNHKVVEGDFLRPYLRNVDVQWDGINTKNLPTINIRPDELDRYTAKAGDVLVCEGGEVGRAAVWWSSEPIVFQKALHRLRVLDSQRDDPRYLVAALRTARARGAFDSGRVSTISHLTGDQIRRHRFAWPPFSEQVAIADSVAVRKSAFDKAAARDQREISLLQEFRTRLVADVVTGQVDVRGIAANLPDVDPGAAWGDSASAELGEPAEFEDQTDDVTDASEE